MFLHKSICSNTKTKSIDGLVEIQWYTPGQKKFEVTQIKELITILNLRGDASQMKDKVNILKKFSDLIVIIADSHKDFKDSLFFPANEDDRNFLWVNDNNDAPKAAKAIN